MSVLTLERVAARRAEFDPAAALRRAARALMTLCAALFFAVGWVAGRAVTFVVAGARAVLAATLWSAAAISLGWSAARPAASGVRTS